MSSPRKSGAGAGLAAALAAYGAWGLFPVYFRALAGVPPLEVLGHRVLWSAGFLALLLTALRRWGAVAALVAAPRRLLLLVVTAALVSTNWLIFIWAVGAGRTLDSSLGYFMNPLVNVALGVLFLRESLTRVQLAAIAIAAAGVLSLVATAGHVPWVSLALAVTFGLYGLLRKRGAIDPVGGLFLETLALAPAAALYLALLHRGGQGHFGAAPGLLAVSGALTALPLIWFAVAVQRLRLSTVGLLQYLAPSLQFTVAVALFGERFTRAHAVAFGCIWVSLALYSAEALREARRAEARG